MEKGKLESQMRFLSLLFSTLAGGCRYQIIEHVSQSLLKKRMRITLPKIFATMRVLRDVSVTACMFILMYSATGYLYKKVDIEKSTLTWSFVLLHSALLGLYFFLLHKKIAFIGIFISLLSVIALSLMFLYEGVFMIIGPLAVLVAIIGVNNYTSNSEV